MWMKLVNGDQKVLVDQILPFYLRENNTFLKIRAARIFSRIGHNTLAKQMLSGMDHPLARAELQGILSDENTPEIFHEIISQGVVRGEPGDMSPLVAEATAKSYFTIAECHLYLGQLENAKKMFHRAIGAGEVVGLDNLSLKADMHLVWLDFYQEKYKDCANGLRKLIPLAYEGGYGFLVREMCRRYIWSALVGGEDISFALPYLDEDDALIFSLLLRRFDFEKVEFPPLLIEKDRCELHRIIRAFNVMVEIQEGGMYFYERSHEIAEDEISRGLPGRENENEFFLVSYVHALLLMHLGRFDQAIRIAEENLSDGLISRTSTSRSLKHAVILNAMICKQDSMGCQMTASRLILALVDLPRGVVDMVVDLLAHLPQVLYYLQQFGFRGFKMENGVEGAISSVLNNQVLLVGETQAKLRGRMVKDILKDHGLHYPRTMNRVWLQHTQNLLDRTSDSVDKTLKRHREALKILKPRNFVMTSFVENCVPGEKRRVRL